jgi:hypothetical protein
MAVWSPAPRGPDHHESLTLGLRAQVTTPRGRVKAQTPYFVNHELGAVFLTNNQLFSPNAKKIHSVVRCLARRHADFTGPEDRSGSRAALRQ